ncbi:MAG: T9SS type A sorting domain-containing protein [Bacteroidota bacterium]|nr:T9SS type A sorting domain-containing protein [Bacteroidota bacterium]
MDLRDSSDAAGDAVYFRMYTDTNTINTGYTDMFFVDQFDDTLNVYNTWGYWLPNTTNIPNDTVDYVLYFLPGITSFPTNFNGHLVTRNPGCQIPFSRSVMGKEEFEQKEKDAFYPNPTDGILRWGPNIGDPPYTLNVYSFFGQIITTIHSSTPEWNLTGISSGFYFLEVQTRSKTHREKVRVN